MWIFFFLQSHWLPAHKSREFRSCKQVQMAMRTMEITSRNQVQRHSSVYSGQRDNLYSIKRAGGHSTTQTDKGNVDMNEDRGMLMVHPLKSGRGRFCAESYCLCRELSNKVIFQIRSVKHPGLETLS